MRRTLGSAFVLLVLVAPATAQAGEVSGALVSCTGGDFCRYFPEPRLEVTFRAARGEPNELSIRPNPDGVRIVDAGAGIEPRAFCTAVDANAAQCGPQPAAGLIATARTGDGADSAFADIGSVFLGRGDDHGIAEGASLYGGPGNDRLLSATSGNSLAGGAGRDYLTGTNADELLIGGSGKDRLVARGGMDHIEGGPGADFVAGGARPDRIYAGSGDDVIHAADPHRDVVRCGRGNDRAVVRANDRVFGCERVIYRELG